MNNLNPYAPPKAAVADVEVHTDDDVRPTRFGTMATIFYGVHCLLGIATTVLLLTPTSNRWFKKRAA